MNCTQCGKELENAARYCPACGTRTGLHGPRLVRAPAAGRIGGVCAGIAAYLDTDVVLVRMLWVALSIVPGGFIGGVIAYIAAWIIMPDPIGPEPSVRATFTRSLDRKLAGVCGGIADYLAVDSTAVRVAWAILTIVPGGIILGVLAYIAAWLIVPEPPLSAPRSTSRAIATPISPASP